MLLKRVWLALLFFTVCLMGWMPMHSAEAGTFQLLEDSGRLVDMKNNEKTLKSDKRKYHPQKRRETK